MIINNIKFGVMIDSRTFEYVLKNNDIHIYYNLDNVSGVTHQFFKGSIYEFIFESDFEFSESDINISMGPKAMMLT